MELRGLVGINLLNVSDRRREEDKRLKKIYIKLNVLKRDRRGGLNAKETKKEGEQWKEGRGSRHRLKDH